MNRLSTWLVPALILLSPVAGRGAQPAAVSDKFDPEPVAALLELVIDADADTARQCLSILARKVQSGELSPATQGVLRDRLKSTLGPILRDRRHPLFIDAALLATSWRDATAAEAVRAAFADARQADGQRLSALAALVAAGEPATLTLVGRALEEDPVDKAEFHAGVIAALGRLEQPEVADVVLARYERLAEQVRPKAIELLTQRTRWSRTLLAAIADDKLPASALNANQVTRLLASRDQQLVELVRSTWGTIRTERNPQREQVIAQTREFLQRTPGVASRGQAIFQRVCGQCHTIYGQGQDVGPDITSNGRSSYDQLLSNVLDPSLVIGAAYQARTILTLDGRVLSGLLVEDSPQRVVLKLQGGKLETIPRDDIDELRVSQLSLMPEGLEQQLKPQELADLFAFLVLDKPPDDPTALRLPGTDVVAP